MENHVGDGRGLAQFQLVPFFLLFGFNKGTQKEKGQKGTTGEPRGSSLQRSRNLQDLSRTSGLRIACKCRGDSWYSKRL